MDAHFPEGLEPDTYDGSAWLSVVPFTNVAVRPKGVPEPPGIRLPELNVRTSVTRDGVPSVYSSASTRRASRASSAPESSTSCRTTTPGSRWSRRTAGCAFAVAGGIRVPAPPATRGRAGRRAVFGARRRLRGASRRALPFYTEAQDGSIRHTDVEHDPWTLYPADAEIATNTLLSARGFGESDADPVYYYSPGLDVVASRSKRL